MSDEGARGCRCSVRIGEPPVGDAGMAGVAEAREAWLPEAGVVRMGTVGIARVCEEETWIAEEGAAESMGMITTIVSAFLSVG